jgi:rhomboid protease GluP
MQPDKFQGEAAEAFAAEAELYRSLRETTPRLIVMPALLVINIVVFALMVIKGVSIMSPGIDDLLNWGADFGPLTTGGEYWRLLTCTFVHIGVLHLAFNMWVLWDLGRLVERMVGNVGFACLYFVTGLLASVCSVWMNPMLVSAGASGAVFGVAGALVGIITVDRGVIPAARLARLRRSVGIFVAYNIVYGFTQPNIDQAAHVGGLIAGVLCGLLFAKATGRQGVPYRLRRILALVAVGAIAIPSLAMALPRDTAEAQKALDEFVVVEGRVLDDIREANKRGLNDADFAALLQMKIIPDWTAAREQLDALANLPESFQKRVDVIRAYASAREEGWRMLVEAIQEDDPQLAKLAGAKQQHAEELLTELRAPNEP